MSFQLELLLIRFHVSTDGASECELFSIGRMFYFQFAFLGVAFGEPVFGVLAHIISGTLSFMAVFAEVRCSPAEPRGDLAAELAFILDEIFSVQFTVGNPCNST